jgi:hypothetical protein
MGGSAAGNLMLAAAHAAPFLHVCGDVVLAWQLLWRATVAEKTLAAGAKEKDAAFYEGQVRGAEYFVQTVLPVTLGRMQAILDGCPVAAEIPDDAFGGK